MIHTYFEYITTQYPAQSVHGMLLISLHGPSRGQPWTTAAARGMLRRAAARVEIGRVVPHASGTASPPRCWTRHGAMR